MTNLTPISAPVAIDMLIAQDIEAQRAIHDWEAERQRVQAVLRQLVTEPYASDAGKAGWETRKGAIDYKAALEHLVGLVHRLHDDEHDKNVPNLMRFLESAIHAVTEDIEFFRKPESASFYVRPPLRKAPVTDVQKGGAE